MALYIRPETKMKALLKNKILDLRFPRSWVYNIFVNEKGKNHLWRIALGEKFNEKMNFNLEIIPQ